MVCCLCFAAWLSPGQPKNWPGPHWYILLQAPPPAPVLPPPQPSIPIPTMAMSNDPAPERLEPELDPDKQSCILADAMAAVTVQDSDGHSVRIGTSHNARNHLSRPNLSGRKLSLQERGTYSSSGAGRGYMSSREARRPTVESKRVSISDSQVSLRLIEFSFSVFFHTQVSYRSTWLSGTKNNSSNKKQMIANQPQIDVK